MIRGMVKFFAGCLILLLGTLGAYPPSDMMINIGSHRLQTHIEGNGIPIVVIDAGIGDQIEKLRPLQERIASVTQVITYNRAGYGQSDAGPLPRHSGREAEEMKTLLVNAATRGPYVIVGHSLGALNMQVFAAKFPEDVVGIVLLDPPPLSFIRREEYLSIYELAEQMTAEWQAIADSSAKSSDAQERKKALFFNMIASEHREMFGESARLVSEISSFGNTPLLVMAAGKANPFLGDLAEEYQRYWIEQSRIISYKSSKGKFVLAQESSHHLYLDVLDLVADRIQSIVNDIRVEK